MIFVFPLTIAPSPPQTSPLVSTLQLTAGRIRRVNVQFPSGVVGLAFVSLFLGLYQIFPSNSDAAFTSSGETVWWDDDFDLSQPPFQLTAKGWNNDVVNSHTITVRIAI